jgi:hypothetical protein
VTRGEIVARKAESEALSLVLVRRRVDNGLDVACHGLFPAASNCVSKERGEARGRSLVRGQYPDPPVLDGRCCDLAT